VVVEGVSGHVCRSMRELTSCIRGLNIKPAVVRRYVEENFSVDVMVRNYISLYQETLQNRNKEHAA
jgi:hypothetical protein